MNPETCEHAEIVGDLPVGDERDWRGVVCAVVVGLTGVRCGHAIGACALCAHDKGDATQCRALAKAHLDHLIRNGNQEGFADTKDLMVLAENYAELSTEAERLTLLAAAADTLADADALTAEDVLDQLDLIDMGLGTAGLEAVL